MKKLLCKIGTMHARNLCRTSAFVLHVLALSFILFSSCAQKAYSAGGSFGRSWTTNPGVDEYKFFDGLNDSEPYAFPEEDSYDSCDKEMRYVYKIEKKIKFKPSKSEKYNQKLQQMKEKLQQQYEARVAERLKFLQGFYASLFQLSDKDFTNKYKTHCTVEILQQLKSIYKAWHDYLNGYAWSVFSDNQMHGGKDFRFTYLDGDPVKVENKAQAQYMFGDSVKQRLIKYRFTNMEDKWFRVDMGKQCVMVQVDGQGDYITITGLVNPRLNFVVKNQIDRRMFIGQPYYRKYRFMIEHWNRWNTNFMVGHWNRWNTTSW